MDPRREFFGERLIDEALSGNPALAGKSGGDDSQGEVRLSLRAGARMPRVAMRLVDDLQSGRGEPVAQLLANGVGDALHREIKPQGGSG